MNIKTTFLAAAFAVTAVSASAATLTVGSDTTFDVEARDQLDGSLALNFQDTLSGDDFTLDRAFNLRDYTAILFDPTIFTSGSLTLTTYVDPFAAFGQGAASVLLRVAQPLADGATVTVRWGDGDAVDLSSQTAQSISTIFTAAEEAGAQDLVFTWSGLEAVQQLSSNITVSAVPLPAGLLLMTTALGGLGLARRRRKNDA